MSAMNEDEYSPRKVNLARAVFIFIHVAFAGETVTRSQTKTCN